MPGLIYKIENESLENGKIYIGSTFNYSRRKTDHKRSCALNLENKFSDLDYLYTYINMNGGWSSFNINVIEIFETIDRIGLSLKESFWMIHYGELCINERLPINDLTITLEDGYELSTVGQKIVDVFPISVDWDISRWIRNTNSGDCVCGGSYDNFDYHTKHDDVHLEYLMSLSVQCECGVKFFYNTQYPHFREKEHKNWIDGDKSKYNLVKLICKCGKIINYSDRVEHNKTH